MFYKPFTTEPSLMNPGRNWLQTAQSAQMINTFHCALWQLTNDSKSQQKKVR